MRTIEITNEKILKFLEEKNITAKENLELIEKMAELEKEYNKKTSYVKRIDEKVRPLIIKKVKDENFGEYEEMVRVFKNEKSGKWEMEIIDRMEQFKENFKNAPRS